MEFNVHLSLGTDLEIMWISSKSLLLKLVITGYQGKPDWWTDYKNMPFITSVFVLFSR
jgi:hypothetical protein